MQATQESQAARRELRPLLVALDRRTLLKTSLAAGLALGAGSLLPGCGTTGPGAERLANLQFFSPGEGYVLETFAATLLPPHPPRPTVAETHLIARLDKEIDWLHSNDDPDLGRDLKRLVRLIEYGPLFIGFHFTRFTRLDEPARQAYLHDLERHRTAMLRMAFRNLRALCVFFYLVDQRTWPSIRYAGPWLTGGATTLEAWRQADA